MFVVNSKSSKEQCSKKLENSLHNVFGIFFFSCRFVNEYYFVNACGGGKPSWKYNIWKRIKKTKIDLFANICLHVCSLKHKWIIQKYETFFNNDIYVLWWNHARIQMKYFNFVALLTQQYSCFIFKMVVVVKNEYFEPLWHTTII